MSPESIGQELVPLEHRRAIAGQYEMGLDAENGTGGGRHSTVVRLTGTHRDETCRTGRHGVTTEELQFAGLVATHAQAGQIVALDPQSGTVGKARTLLDWRWQGGQGDTWYVIPACEPICAPQPSHDRRLRRPSKGRICPANLKTPHNVTVR